MLKRVLLALWTLTLAMCCKCCHLVVKLMTNKPILKVKMYYSALKKIIIPFTSVWTNTRLRLFPACRRSGGPVGVRGAHQGASARAGRTLSGPLLPLLRLPVLVPHPLPQRPALPQRRLRGRQLLLPRHQGHLPAGPGRAGGQRRAAICQHGRRTGSHDSHQVGAIAWYCEISWWWENQ